MCLSNRLSNKLTSHVTYEGARWISTKMVNYVQEYVVHVGGVEVAKYITCGKVYIAKQWYDFKCLIFHSNYLRLLLLGKTLIIEFSMWNIAHSISESYWVFGDFLM